MNNEPCFRAGSGSIVYKDDGQILIFKRSDRIDSWQLQQGGLDDGETPTKALWRELYEETGLQPNDFTEVIEYPNWTLYAYPNDIRHTLKHPPTLGQVHRWFFLKLAPAVVPDLSKATDKEFTDLRWATFDELLALNDSSVSFKYHVYLALKNYFETNIIKSGT